MGERAVAAGRWWFMRSSLILKIARLLRIAECNLVIPRARRWRYAVVGFHM